MIRRIGEFKVGVGLTGTIWVAVGECHICHQKRPCICVDSSTDESGDGRICQQCAEAAFAGPLEQEEET